MSLERLLRNEADMSTKHRIRVLLEYLAIQPGERVLDCGCGYGWPLKILVETQDCRLVGADRDLVRLRTARREAGPDAAIVGADIADLPFPDETFDKVLISEVLEHLTDDLGALREARRVTRRGGLIAITVPNHHYPLLWDPINWTRERLGMRPIRGGFFGGIWTDHVRLYSRQEITALVGRAQLSVEDVRGLVHYCVPFAHNLVYGLGKALIDHGLLASADRFRYADNTGSLWSPLNVGRRVINAVDRLNASQAPEGQTTVVITVKARKP